jgi:hypothetical protein
MPKSRVNNRGGRIGVKACRTLRRNCRRATKKRNSKKFPVVAEKDDQRKTRRTGLKTPEIL